MLHPAIYISDSFIEGKGLFASALIRAGSTIWMLDGSELYYTYADLMNMPLARRRLAYLQGDRYCITTDGSAHMNHACDPNVWWDGDEAMTARRDIQPGEEITCDYGAFEIEAGPRPAFWGCCCGSANCRRIITIRDCIKPALLRAYDGHVPSWTLNLINKYHAKKGQ